MRGLNDRVAVVTGGGGEIGREICIRLSDAGCKVAVLDLDEGRANDTAAEIQSREKTRSP